MDSFVLKDSANDGSWSDDGKRQDGKFDFGSTCYVL